MKTRRRPIAVMLLYPLAVDGPMTALTGVIRLAGNPEYNMASSRSPYADEVEQHCGAVLG